MSISVNAQIDSRVDESARQSIKSQESKAHETRAKHERAELKEKTEDLKIARLRQQRLQSAVERDKLELKKQKALTENLEAKIKEREKTLAEINNDIKETETAISKLQSQANNNKKTHEQKPAKNTSD